MNRKSFTATLIGIIILTSFGIASIYNSFDGFEGSILDRYNAEEEAFWNYVPEDVLIYAIYDKFLYENGFNSTSYALLRNEILSIDDLGVDTDTYPDLLLNSEFLIGNENFGMTLGQYFDLNFLGVLVPILLSQLSGSLTQLNSSNLYFPTFSSMHIVNSRFLYILDLVGSVLEELGKNGEESPTYSFDYNTLGSEYTSDYLRTNCEDPNTITVEQMPSIRNFSQGLSFNLIDETKDCILESYNLDESELAGNFSYKFYRTENDSMFISYQIDELGDPIDSNGVILGINGTDLCYFQGKYVWFDNGLIQTWVENELWGNWTKICSVPLTTWNNLTVEYPANYSQPLTVHINGAEYSDVNYSVFDPNYDFKVTNSYFELTQSPAQFYFDSLDYAVKIISQESAIASLYSDILFLFNDIPLGELFGIFGLYNMLFYPKTFNFDAFYDLWINIMRLLDSRVFAKHSLDISLEQAFKGIVQNTEDSFKFSYNSTQWNETWSYLQTTFLKNLFDFSTLHFLNLEGDVTWELTVSWDKQITALNGSYINVHYLDLGAERELGMKLIATRSPNRFQDGYTYYNGSWFDSNITTPLSRPYVRTVSQLNNDSYPSYIPEEWDVFNHQTLTEAFVNEFEYNALIDDIVRDNLGFLSLAFVGVIGSSSLLTILIYNIVERVKKRRMRPV